jgi:putative phosphoribosyl transferase
VSTMEAIKISAGEVTLTGELSVPADATGAVVFAHAGHCDLAPRTRLVTDLLAEAGLATLALDLLTEVEADEHENVFDVALLADRLETATWRLQVETGLPVAYLAVGTAASAALQAAAEEGAGVGAVVAFGSWPALAASHLAQVKAPTLLVVGGADGHVLDLNRAALDELPACEHDLAVVPGATHLFEQAGALEHATALAVGWFSRHVR